MFEHQGNPTHKLYLIKRNSLENATNSCQYVMCIENVCRTYQIGIYRYLNRHKTYIWIRQRALMLMIHDLWYYLCLDKHIVQ